MQRSHPLQSTNPEYSLLESPGRYEFRVENWHLARDGSGRIIKGATSLNVFDAVMVVIFVWAWPHLVRIYFPWCLPFSIEYTSSTLQD